MRWDQLPRSDDIEDRRNQSGYVRRGGRLNIPIGRGRTIGAGRGGGLGIGTIVVVVLLAWALGIDPTMLLTGGDVAFDNGSPTVQTSGEPGRVGTPDDPMGQFVAAVLGSANVQWSNIFAETGGRYHPPSLVMYRQVTEASCGQGLATSAMGPFYCPSDHKIYLDTAFFDEIERRFQGCPVGSSACKFAQAYVIAHEVGHHVQNELGILAKVHAAQRDASSRAAVNALQVRVELQADCFAGIWAARSDQQWNLLEPGDVDAALRTAAAIGDDTLQRRAQGYAVPDSFTHGTSEQRQRWFSAGLKSGDLDACNTFAARQL